MSKIIYRITPDVNHFKVIFPDDKELRDPDLWKSDCQSKETTLIRFNAHYNDERDKPIGDFTAVNWLGLAVRDVVANELTEILEKSGELLPFHVGDDLWYYYNVMRKVEGFLNKEESTFLTPGLNIGLKKAVFNREKLPKRSCIFKTPEDRFQGTYVLDSRADDRDVLANFFCAVHAHGFKGLEFEEMARFD